LIQIASVGEWIPQSKLSHIPVEFDLAICKAGASMLVPKLVIIALYYKFKQSSNILIHIFTS